MTFGIITFFQISKIRTRDLQMRFWMIDLPDKWYQVVLIRLLGEL